MTTITVKGLTIQFDSSINVKSIDELKETVQKAIDAFNETLNNAFPDSSPQIFTSAIDNDDIEIQGDAVEINT